MPPSPATFAVAAVWWRMAQVEDPLGYLGAEYLFEQLTALVTQAALPIIQGRALPRDGLRFVIEHATEDVKHATFIKHLILDVATRYPDSAQAMLRCFDYFHAVYPLPVWDEAFERAMND
jgi:pyrroloquinoline quinone (PQQ) biosynthesis protein C